MPPASSTSFPVNDMEAVLSSIVHRADDTYLYEQTLHNHGYPTVAGLDEAGRGPLAGPVVAACVILPRECNHSLFLDSKKLSASRRQTLARSLHDIKAAIGIGIVSHQTIDQINILQASLLAMRRAVDNLPSLQQAPDFLLIDGKFSIPIDIPQQALIKGESKSASIAAASIIAKTHRDALMAELDKKYPIYQFARHQGYPTKAHRQAIVDHGPCPYHRKTFKGVREFV